MRSEKYIQPDELNVDNVFENVNYVIPIYQRNYAWRKDEIEQLLMDIDDLDETNSSKYYLGSFSGQSSPTSSLRSNRWPATLNYFVFSSSLSGSSFCRKKSFEI